MNRIQKNILVIGIIVIVLMGIYPPWTFTGYILSTGLATPENAGDYALITKPPGNCKIDLGRLGVQWAVVAIATGGLLVIFKDSKNTKEFQARKNDR
jgi:hypothetical protein